MISETKINESFQISQFLIDGLMGGDKLQCLFKKCLNDFNTDDITVDIFKMTFWSVLNKFAPLKKKYLRAKVVCINGGGGSSSKR